MARLSLLSVFLVRMSSEFLLSGFKLYRSLIPKSFKKMFLGVYFTMRVLFVVKRLALSPKFRSSELLKFGDGVVVRQDRDFLFPSTRKAG